MSYKRKKFFGPPIKRGGYIPTKDYMEHYRVFPQQEDEYHRKLRQELEKNEHHMSHFRDTEPHYKTNPVQESFSKQNLDDFQDSLFNRVMEEMKERQEVSQEVYDNAKEVTEAIQQNQDMGVAEFTEKMLSMDDDISQINYDLDKLDNEISEELLDTQNFLNEVTEVIPDTLPQRKSDSEVGF
ncbi:hypothetical protein C6990_05305 [Nitrosopumilus sp. b3]|uniref:hypothetical protein n=1 Tax=Nitrosopumilus sp. b3 TaxID=2109909 RepID=UPI0015F4D851|nr:hypothetical protein [Nitrosopumilus sp. b3]KAF6247098.1 hypothetical protein C6990_05305 [Nitrosopumilus sp. b3]